MTASHSKITGLIRRRLNLSAYALQFSFDSLPS